MQLKTNIGLEIHAELKTNSKAFCGCSTKESPENTNICEICTGHPGTLPLLNYSTLELAIMAGISLNCNVNNKISFDRKNYFYPDTPKSYQITQYYEPICSSGYLILENGKKIRIRQIQIEEDAAKMFHNNEGSNGTLLDFNRSGIPLIEIISEPDIENSEECVEFIKTITLILRHLNISNARMNKGEIRADVNISLAIKKNELYENGNRIEIKNLNSLENIQKAIKYEEKRQVELINDHKIIEEETRKFDENKNLTLLMRKKQSTNDYRYFRDSNIPAVYISDFEIENIKNKMKVLPSIKFQKYIKNYGLNSEDANTLIWAGPDITDFFDETIIQYKNYKIAASFILTEVLRWMKELNITKIPFPVKYFISLLEMMEKGEINRNDAKKILKIMFETGKDPYIIAKEEKMLILEINTEVTFTAINEILNEKKDLVDKYLNGKTNLFGYFMGESLNKLKGKDTTENIKKTLENLLNKNSKK